MLPAPRRCPFCHGPQHAPLTTVRAWEHHVQSAMHMMSVEVGCDSHVKGSLGRRLVTQVRGQWVGTPDGSAVPRVVSVLVRVSRAAVGC